MPTVQGLIDACFSELNARPKGGHVKLPSIDVLNWSAEQLRDLVATAKVAATTRGWRLKVMFLETSTFEGLGAKRNGWADGEYDGVATWEVIYSEGSFVEFVVESPAEGGIA